jgi:alcohol dehydrogenase
MTAQEAFDETARPPVDSQAWWSFATAGRISFGVGCARFLPDVLQAFGERVLFCTDANLVAAGVVEPLAALVRASGNREVLVYDGGEAEIGFVGAERCCEQVRSFSPTVVVGVGGGSNLDLAKVVATRLTAGRPVDKWQEEGVPASALPIVALPTTAGTGSEVTPIAVLTDEANQVKVGFPSRSLLPRAVLVDPLLTISCPPRVTAWSGMDALSHAVEAYMAIDYSAKGPRGYDDQSFVGKNPVSDALALDAISRIGANLPRAVATGDDLVARTEMALASLLAGMAFSTAGTAIVHALQYPIGALTKTAHGLGNAVLMPAAARFNTSSRPHEAAQASWALGSSALSAGDAAAELPDLLGNLALAVGITPNLRSLGVVEADLQAIALSASRITRLTANNPRSLDEAALLEVLRDALDFAPRVVQTRGGDGSKDPAATRNAG